MCSYLVWYMLNLLNLLLLLTKNLAAYPGMIRNQIQLHGLLNKSKEKNSILLILLHFDVVFLDLVAEGVDHQADGFDDLGLELYFQIYKKRKQTNRWYRFLPLGGYGSYPR